jgi:perosamine synthetase
MNTQLLLKISDEFVSFAKDIFGPQYMPLHRPVFEGNEKRYLAQCIDSNFVSSVGAQVIEFENQVAHFAGTRYAVATVNGTAALHIALLLAGVRPGDIVLSQALTFIATCNALAYSNAEPAFIDVDLDTMGMSPVALKAYLEQHVDIRDGQAVERSSGRRVSACVPMHTFGLPCRIEAIVEICTRYGIPVVEDAAESMGSYSAGQHTGTFGKLGTLSFNGNKTITTGGGGMIICNDEAIAKRAKHLTTTAKRPHPYEFFHDEVGYNYRLPNLNAALGCAQMERLPEMLAAKAQVAARYNAFFAERDIPFLQPREGCVSNYWLNAIVLPSQSDRDAFLKATNDAGVMTRPIWTLMSKLPMFNHCMNDGLKNSEWLEARVVNIPSSVPDGALAPFSGAAT